MSSIFGTKEEILARIAAFEKLNAWTAANPTEWSADDSISAVSDLYSLMPGDARFRRDDPKYAGARFMLRTLEQLRG